MHSLQILSRNMVYVSFLGLLTIICFFSASALDFIICFPFYIPDSSFVPPLVYAFMGSSRDIAIGPVAVVSLLLGTLLQDVIDPSKDPINYLHLAFTATFFAGITQATLGFLRYAGCC